jgi:hypothetical protein
LTFLLAVYPEDHSPLRIVLHHSALIPDVSAPEQHKPVWQRLNDCWLQPLLAAATTAVTAIDMTAVSTVSVAQFELTAHAWQPLLAYKVHCYVYMEYIWHR